MRLIDADTLKLADFQDFSNADVFCAIDDTPTVDTVPTKLLNEALTLLKAAEREAWIRCDCNYCAVVGCARLTGTRRKCLAGDGSWKWQYADRYEKLKVAAERTNKNESN